MRIKPSNDIVLVLVVAVIGSILCHLLPLMLCVYNVVPESVYESNPLREYRYCGGSSNDDNDADADENRHSCRVGRS